MATILTKEGYQKLQDDLKRLKSVDRPEVIKEIVTAREQGDLSENAEYDAAKEKQGFIETKIAEIESKLATAQIVNISDMKTDEIMFGATVTVLDVEDGMEETYTLVGSDEVNVDEGVISIESPIGRGLLNKKVGDTATVKSPGGEFKYKIKSIKYI